MITNDIRQKRVREVSENIFDIYTSTELTLKIKQSVLTFQITNKDAFVDLVGDVLIGLVPRNTFEQSLVSEIKLAPDVARSVTQELKSLFDRAEGTTRPEANLETKERLDLRPQNTSVPAQGEATQPKPLTREELMNALGGKRTMAQDIEALRMKRDGGGQ